MERIIIECNGKRYAKTIRFSTNMDLLDMVIHESDTYFKTLFSWIGLNVEKDSKAEQQLIRCLNIFSEEAFFKLDNQGAAVIFNLESLYKGLLETGENIDVYGDGEEKGSLRILHSALNEDMFIYLNCSGHNVAAVDTEKLRRYYERVQTYHMLNTCTTLTQEKQVDNPETTRVSLGDNTILYGVPGCGKSHKIKTEYCNDENLMERVVFHPDYTYSDFVGQILPTNINGHISYPFVPGPFTRILKKSVNDPEHNYYLVIEELNRGNAPAIFGEVFQLLDRIDGISEYGINNADIANEVYGNETHLVKLPQNLFILATMNTADQNVFTLDTAFKRRWRMRSITNDITKCFFANDVICNTGVTWSSFLSKINEKVVEFGEGNIGSEDKRLGAFFLQKRELSDVDSFSEKVLLYLWNDAFKYDHDRVFKQEYKTLEQLIEGFKSIGFGIFTDEFSFELGTSLHDTRPDDSTEMTPEQYLEGKSDQSRELYQQILEELNDIGIEYSVSAVKNYISIKAPSGNVAAELHLQTARIKIMIKEPTQSEYQIGRKVPDTFGWTKNYEIICDAGTDIGAVASAIVDSYDQVNG